MKKILYPVFISVLLTIPLHQIAQQTDCYISDQKFQPILNTLKNVERDGTRFDIAKNLFKHNDCCFSSTQIYELAGTFKRDGEKLDFLIFALKYSYEDEETNYYRISETCFKRDGAKEDFLHKLSKLKEKCQPPVKNKVQIVENNEEVKVEVIKTKTVYVPDVDENIPHINKNNPNVYALIIGNENYSLYQADLSSESNCEFAANDARIFKEYCIKTLGIPEENIDLKINATLGQMKQAISKLKLISEVKEGQAEILFYYSGHGLPDEETKEPYLIPVDIDGYDVKAGIGLNNLYKDLTKFESEKVTVILDACFSGGARNKGLVALKGVIIPQKTAINGNLVVFTSSSGSESSTVYRENKHGLFTYYLLKKLQETKGEVTYRELSDYLGDMVSIESIKQNSRKQTPQTIGSNRVETEWEEWKMNE